MQQPSRSAAALVVLAMGLDGCYEVVREYRQTSFVIETEPAGAAVRLTDPAGREVAAGQSPLPVEHRYPADVRRFNKNLWAIPATGGVMSLLGLALLVSAGQSTGLEGLDRGFAGLILAGVGLPLALGSGIPCLIGQFNDGTPDPVDPPFVRVHATSPGYAPANEVLPLGEVMRTRRLRLTRESDPASAPEPTVGSTRSEGP